MAREKLKPQMEAAGPVDCLCHRRGWWESHEPAPGIQPLCHPAVCNPTLIAHALLWSLGEGLEVVGGGQLGEGASMLISESGNAIVLLSEDFKLGLFCGAPHS